MDGPLPIGGTTQSCQLDSDGYLPKRKLAFGDSVRALGSFAQRFAFFTLAIPYLWGEFRDAILADFISLRKQPVELFHTRFHRPLFRGLETRGGNSDWNHVLLAVELPHWEALLDHVCSAVGADNMGKRIFRYALQDFTVLDPIAAARTIVMTAQMPVVTVHVFGVRSDRYTAALKQEQMLAIPYLTFYEPDEGCKLYARALFNADDPQLAMKLDKESHSEDQPEDTPGG